MLDNIKTLNQGKKEILPMILKLGTLRRQLMLSGLDTKKSEMQQKGRSILDALKKFKAGTMPDMFSADSFSRLLSDPLGRIKVLTEAEQEEKRLRDFNK